MKYPEVTYAGIADGEKGNWSFLSNYTQVQIIDFWHATEYLAGYAKSVYTIPGERDQWLKYSRSMLKDKRGSAGKLLKEMENYARDHNLDEKDHPVIRAVTYFAVR